nr:unnamed protein product [Spirometra erinaceieuropaei]
MEMSSRVPAGREVSLKRLQIDPVNWEDLAQDRSTWRRTVQTGAAIYGASRIAAVKAKSDARKLHLCAPHNANVQPPRTCPRCQWTFRARIGLGGHLRINCPTRTAPTVVPPSSSSSSSTPPTNCDRSSEPPLPSSTSPTSWSSSSTYSFSSSSSAASKPAVVAPATHINTEHNPDTSSNINNTIFGTRCGDQDYTYPHCDRTFTPHIGLIGHLRIPRTKTGEPVPDGPA